MSKKFPLKNFSFTSRMRGIRITRSLLFLFFVLAFGSVIWMAHFLSIRHFNFPNTSIHQLYFSHHSWQTLSYLDTLDESKLAPLTKEAQRWIFEHQNPPNSQCKRAKYLQVWWNAGLGSNIATAATFLAYALEEGYILQWHPEAAKYLVEDGCSRDLPYSGMECIFEPLSTCGAEFMTKENTLKAARGPIVPAGEITPSDIAEFSVFCPNFGEEVPANQTNPYPAVTCNHPVPSYFTQRLGTYMRSRGISVTRGFINYYFHAQAVAYIARVNKETRAELAELRQAAGLVVGYTNSEARGHAQVGLPFPLPPGSFNVHVRHGDKYIEQPLFPLKRYVQLAEQLVVANPLFHKRVMFLSTEDPAVFKEAAKLTRMKKEGSTPDMRWVVATLNHTRPDNDLPWPRQLELLGKQHVLFWILELFIAMECDAWVASRGSGWDRLIDQLRCVWVDKCNAPFMEVSDVGHY